ncbi:hypothetical protein GBF38_004308 [Nibea albiflora]|uniref:Uncharacterized protein n=1 Tax=Nibea albiflora TaxID=240163 RepID=A0ACB7FCP2_NIBAL|nr:hypothetical protein GBF38_004308 [Nibea albiflora]
MVTIMDITMAMDMATMGLIMAMITTMVITMEVMVAMASIMLGRPDSDAHLLLTDSSLSQPNEPDPKVRADDNSQPNDPDPKVRAEDETSCKLAPISASY